MSNNKHGGVGVRNTESGETRVCASGDVGAGYGTLCGTSLNDDMFEEVDISERARINCPMCKSTWQLAKTFKAANFA